MQMEALATALTSAAPPDAPTRAPFAFAVRFPLRPLLRKELAEQYIGMGLVGAALRVFEELGMWDQLILCYQLLDKRQVARELIQQRLKVGASGVCLLVLDGVLQCLCHASAAGLFDKRAALR